MELLPGWIVDLAPRQRDIVAVVYRRGGATSREIHASIPDAPRSLCGIRTLLVRMVRKGLLITRPSGRHSEIIYLPARRTPEVLLRGFERLARDHFGGSRARTLQALERYAEREGREAPGMQDAA